MGWMHLDERLDVKINVTRSGSYWFVSVTVQTKDGEVQMQSTSRSCLCCVGLYST